MADIEINELPEGWEITTLVDSCEIIMGQSPPSSTYNDDGLGLPFFQGKSEFGEMYPTVVKWCSEPNKIAEAEDVLISVRAPVGPTNLARERSAIGRGLAALHPELEMPSRFFLYQLRHLEEEIANKGTGTTFAAISKAILEAQQIVLAPLNEQHRIVDEIEAQFSRLDTWLEVMEKLRVELPRLRASILKAAVEGRLVERDPDDEPAEILLQHILDERRQKWEEDYLADLEAKGKPAPKNDKWKEKYPEPEPPDTSDLPELPEGWIWTTIDELSLVVRGASPRPAGDPRYFGGDIPWITVGSLTADNNPYLTLVSEFVTEAGKEKSRYIEPETLLLTNSGATLGVPKITKIGGCINDGSVALKHVEYPTKLYLYYVLFHMTPRLRNINQGAAQPNLNTTIVKNIQVALPPLSEQKRIIDEVEAKLNIVDRLTATIEVNTKRAERMRQSILKQAFEGRLVEQNPNDEPASELLERIQEERKRRAEEEKNKPKQQRERKVSKKTERKSLYDTLKEAGKPLSARDLFQQAGFTHDTVDEFYEELREAVHEVGTIRSKRNKKDEVFLEVSG